MADVPPIISTPGKSAPQTKILLVLLGVLVLAGGVLAYKLYGGKFQLPFGPGGFAPGTPTQAPVVQIPSSWESCEIKKEVNPLVTDVRELNDMIVGTFYGNIGTTAKISDTKYNIQFVSPKADQALEFEVEETPKLVYNAETGSGTEDMSLRDLKMNQTVTVSFNCHKNKESDRFVITGIAVRYNPYTN